MSNKAICLVSIALAATIANLGYTVFKVHDTQNELKSIVKKYEEAAYVKKERIFDLEAYIRYLHDNVVPEMTVEDITTGIRNRNVMNVFARGTKDPWLGQVGKDQAGHAIFATFEHGLRAGAIVLLRYYDKHKLDTVEKIIKRYCTGNHASYINFVAKQLNVKPDEIINVPERLHELMKAIVHFENGYQLFPDEAYIPYSVYR